jgi:molybdopterin-binding protein
MLNQCWWRAKKKVNAGFSWGLWSMKISARNILPGTVTKIIKGAVNDEITLEIAPGVQIVSIITKMSGESLGLAEGGNASAVIKASSVMIAAP